MGGWVVGDEEARSPSPGAGAGRPPTRNFPYSPSICLSGFRKSSLIWAGLNFRVLLVVCTMFRSTDHLLFPVFRAGAAVCDMGGLFSSSLCTSHDPATMKKMASPCCPCLNTSIHALVV